MDTHIDIISSSLLSREVVYDQCPSCCFPPFRHNPCYSLKLLAILHVYLLCRNDGRRRLIRACNIHVPYTHRIYEVQHTQSLRDKPNKHRHKLAFFMAVFLFPSSIITHHHLLCQYYTVIHSLPTTLSIYRLDCDNSLSWLKRKRTPRLPWRRLLCSQRMILRMAGHHRRAAMRTAYAGENALAGPDSHRCVLEKATQDICCPSKASQSKHFTSRLLNDDESTLNLARDSSSPKADRR